MEIMDEIIEGEIALFPEANRELSPVETDTLFGLLSSARSENTKIAYGQAWRAFGKWCQGQGFAAFPAAPATVALYLTHLNSSLGRKASTMNQHLAAISAAHSDNGHDFNFFKNHLIAAALKSAKRSMVDDGRSRIQKPIALSQPEIKQMVDSLPATPQGQRDRALILLGVNAGMRASEYTGLQVGDIKFDGSGMTINIRKSKGDQMGEGQSIYIAGLAPSQIAFDAVVAMREWMVTLARYSDAETLAHQNVFIAFRKGGISSHLIDGKTHSINRSAVSGILIRAFEAAGLTGQKPSSHTLRHSFITQAFSRHLDAVRISKVSRHKNLGTLQAYDQTSYKQNPVSVALWS